MTEAELMQKIREAKARGRGELNPPTKAEHRDFFDAVGFTPREPVDNSTEARLRRQLGEMEAERDRWATEVVKLNREVGDLQVRWANKQLIAINKAKDNTPPPHHQTPTPWVMP